MRGTKTTAEVIIPPKQDEFRVFEISFFPQNKTVRVRTILNESTLPEEKDIRIDISDEWDALSGSRRSNWKAMFKIIVAKAMKITSGEIDGEIWD